MRFASKLRWAMAYVLSIFREPLRYRGLGALNSAYRSRPSRQYWIIRRIFWKRWRAHNVNFGEHLARAAFFNSSRICPSISFSFRFALVMNLNVSFDRHQRSVRTFGSLWETDDQLSNSRNHGESSFVVILKYLFFILVFSSCYSEWIIFDRE